MEQINSTYQLLEFISKPAFCVKDGIIEYTNHSAKSMQIHPGTAINSLISDNLDDYTKLRDGYLFIPLTIAGVSCGATVTKSAQYDIFTLDDPLCCDQLRTLSLAGQQLRIPLASLVASIDTMFTELPTAKLRSYSNQIRKGIHQLHRVINNMSDAVILDNPASTDSTLDIKRITDETIEKSKTFLSDAGVSIHYTGLETSVFIQANRTLLERAIFNMLSNAVKFSDPDCPVHVTVSQENKKVLLSVTNTSANTRPEMLANAFTSYQRKPSIEDTRRGIGLGMPLIRAAAQAHGGTVLIDQPAAGTVRVTLTLTLRQPENPTTLRSSLIRGMDYAGGRDHALLELSDVLPASTYQYESE